VRQRCQQLWHLFFFFRLLVSYKSVRVRTTMKAMDSKLLKEQLTSECLLHSLKANWEPFVTGMKHVNISES
jgi:hypothetical protein